MLPRGMVGQKCHPPLSTIPEVWCCAAGRQASRSARRGWREIRGNSINGRFLRTRERAQLHTHLNVRCTHIVTNATHLWMHTRTSKHILHISHCEGLLTGQESRRNTCSFPGLQQLCLFFFSSLHRLSLLIPLQLNFPSSSLCYQRVGSVESLLSISCSPWGDSIAGSLHCFSSAGQLRGKWGRGGHSQSVTIKEPYLPTCLPIAHIIYR